MPDRSRLPFQTTTWRLLAIWILAAVAGCSAEPQKSELDQIIDAFQAEDFKTVIQLGKTISRDDPHWPEVQVLIGRSEIKRRGPAAGLPYLESVPRDGFEAGFQAARTLSEIRMGLGDFQHAIDDIVYQLEKDPSEALLHRKLGEIYMLSEVRDAGEARFVWLLENDKTDIEELAALSVPDRKFERGSPIKVLLREHPNDPFLNLGVAVDDFRSQKRDEALQRLTKAVNVRPDVPEIQGWLGRVLVDGETQSYLDWYSQVPAAIRTAPDVWLTRGLWAEKHGHENVAARCFWEVLRSRPHDQLANQRLGALMVDLDAVAAAEFSKRAADLKTYAESVEQIVKSECRDLEAIEQAVAILAGMGRGWEAKMWTRIAYWKLGQGNPSVRKIEALNSVEASGTTRFASKFDLTRKFDLSSYQADPPLTGAE